VLRLTQIPPADLHVPILGQLALAQLPLGDALKSGPLVSTPLAAAPRMQLRPLVSAVLRHPDGAVADPRTGRGADEEGRVHSGATCGRRTERTGELGIALRV
jgi:hypothetical protein